VSDKERYGFRDAAYSEWHRTVSIKRFVPVQQARGLGQIDVDSTIWIEYERGNREPIAVIETAVDVGQANKCADVITAYARKADIVGMVVLYKLAKQGNPANPSVPDVERFRVKVTHPDPWSSWLEMTPRRYATMLMRMRQGAHWYRDLRSAYVPDLGAA